VFRPDKIEERRKELGMSVKKLAEILPGKIGPPHVSTWEKGRSVPNANAVQFLSWALEVDVSFFYDEVRPELDQSS